MIKLPDHLPGESSLPNELECDCDCGCNEPMFTDPIEALRFLKNRFEYAGVSDAVARSYARDIGLILAEHDKKNGEQA